MKLSEARGGLVDFEKVTWAASNLEASVDLRGIALGDVWAEPMVIQNAWYTYLKAFGLGDDAWLAGLSSVNRLT